jgi:hypothetical protein
MKRGDVSVTSLSTFDEFAAALEAVEAGEGAGAAAGSNGGREDNGGGGGAEEDGEDRRRAAAAAGAAEAGSGGKEGGGEGAAAAAAAGSRLAGLHPDFRWGSDRGLESFLLDCSALEGCRRGGSRGVPLGPEQIQDLRFAAERFPASLFRPASRLSTLPPAPAPPQAMLL